MNNDDNLDLLDLDDGTSVDALPDTTPFATPRPKKPWLLLAVGLIVIILATYIIVRTIGSDSSSAIEVDLDTPTVSVDVPADSLDVLPLGGMDVPPPAPAVVPASAEQPVAVPQPAAPAPVAQPVVQESGSPVRVIADRNDVTFNPDKGTVVQQKPVAAPAPKKAVSKPAAKPVTKSTVKQQTTSASTNSWYVQLGSYSTRALAESAGQKMRNQHSSLFSGHQFVVLAAVMKDGNTLYRLRVPFATSAAANGFCRNAKSDGIDCYVAK